MGGRVLRVLLATGAAAALTVAHGGLARADAVGGVIAFSSNRDGSAQIYVMDPDGSNQQRLTRSFPSDDTQPAWSPDGARIVFTRGHGYQSSAVGQSSIVAVDVTSHEEHVLSDDAGVNFKPEYSPDGRWIVYVHGAQTATSGPFDLWLMRPDGSDRHALTTTGDVTQPSWSPDGKNIAVNRGTGLALVTVATGAVASLPAPPSGADYTPSWAPENRILFTSTRDGGGKQVYVMNADGTAARRLVRDGAEDKYPAWSGDGSHIVYSRSTVPCTASVGVPTTGGECSLTQLGGFEIFMMNADGSHQVQLTARAIPGTQFGDGYPAWRGLRTPADSPARGNRVGAAITRPTSARSLAVDRAGTELPRTGSHLGELGLAAAALVLIGACLNFVASAGGRSRAAEDPRAVARPHATATTR